jgi:scyllo-inositol 2-dehydrogenase (NADP+)
MAKRKAKPQSKHRAFARKARKILMLVGGPYHPSQEAAKVLAGLLESRGGRWQVTATSEFDALASLLASDYSTVLIYTTGYREDLTPEREKGLLDFVRGGGALVAVHSAADSFRSSRAYIATINAEFQTHPRFQEIPVQLVDRSHYLTARMPDFVIEDELYMLQSHDPARSRVLAETTWQGRRMPLLFVHPYGKGRVAYLALGHDLRAWQHPEFQKLLLRSIEWTGGAEYDAKGEVRVGILGYGPAFHMGKIHADRIGEVPGLRTVAVCDRDPSRVEEAARELPGVRTFTSLERMLGRKDLDLVVNILPHNAHAATTLECLKSGKHVVCEKPFAITTDEATRMIRAARRAGRMLSVFHNRRWDGDYLTIRDIVARGLVGKVFHVECFFGNYERPKTWWRSDKEISGGALYDWGAHFTDWILRLVGKRVTQVTGCFHKRRWNHVTNEDQTEALLRFEDGEAADLQISSLAAASKPKWRILGTEGSLVVPLGNAETVHLTSYASGVRFEGDVPIAKSTGWAEYYRNVADHLLMGEALEVTAEQAREVIAVIETAERSSAEGRSLPLPKEVYGD